MRQVARRLGDGQLELVEVPEPTVGSGEVAVRVEASVLSAGTERAKLDVARKNLLAKARARPDQARQVIERVRTEGLASTARLVRSRLQELGPLGYSAAGRVIEVGADVRGLAVGDQVAIGGERASHGEIDVVPSLLCARVPEGLVAEEAAFATLGAIAMNGFRRGRCEVGSTVAVIGLGLIGQLAVRIARAAGCRVLGVDLKPELVELARTAGAEGLVRADLDATTRWDEAADAVLICAATPSTDPISLAASLARDRAPVVVVGDVAMELPRAPYYEKELELRLSRSYGPGRYDPNYEVHGLDYPIGHVRWTEQRNMSAFLELVAGGGIRPVELITHRFSIDEAAEAFEALESDGGVVGIILGYPDRRAPESAGLNGGSARAPAAHPRRRPPTGGKPRLGLIGAGSFATGVLIPGLVDAGFELVAVASASGLSAADASQRFGFAEACADPAEIIDRDDLDLIAIATRHDSHAELAARSLAADHATYVEKPLALTDAQLRDVIAAQRTTGAALFVGFNRRHASSALELRRLPGPRLALYRVNAGALAPGHWLNDLARGGGRLKGEGCHFIDFLCDQAGCDPRFVRASGFPSSPDLPLAATDNFSIQIEFADGGVGTLHYAADSPTGPGKERFETSAGGSFAVIDDFKTASVWNGRRRRRLSLGGRGQDKGFAGQYRTMAQVVAGDAAPPSPESAYISTLATLAAARSLETGRAEEVVRATEGRRAATPAPTVKWERHGPERAR